MDRQSILTAKRTTLKVAVTVVIVCLLSISFGDAIKWQPFYRFTITIGQPFYWLSNLPSNIFHWFDTNVQSRRSLLAENKALKNENLILKGRQLTFNEIISENTRLRHLLNANELIEFRVLIGEIYGIVPNFHGHRLITNRGSDSGVFIGQPLIDNNGLFGQIIEVSDNSSQVLLISDDEHALSVQNLRSHYRTIAEGIGDFNYLMLRYVPITTDIRLGDEFVTSGLDGVYPKGYSVGKVTKVEKLESEGLINVTLAISAQLQYTRNILFLFTDEAL